MLIHATCIAIDGRGVLITGEAGSGKSDLALRLIDDGAELIADDQTLLSVLSGQLIAIAPESIKGMMEVRHIGLMRLPYRESVPVVLQIDLAPQDEVLERLPETISIFYLDYAVRRLRLPAFAASTPAKIRSALHFEIITDKV